MESDMTTRVAFVLAILAIAALPLRVQAETNVGDPQKLAAAVFTAIRSGDFGNYERLMPTEEQLRAMCPGTRKTRKEYVDSAREGFDTCREKGDWGKASIVEVEGGRIDERNSESACPNASLADNVKFKVNFGKDSTKVKLDNPIVFKGRYFVLAPPRCR
jgi:hypothetical protein